MSVFPQVIFIEPYIDAANNKHSPGLAADVAALRADTAAKVGCSTAAVRRVWG